jgi:hypothetical protein
MEVEQPKDFVLNISNLACKEGDLPTLIHLKENSISLPDVEGADIACMYGHIGILKWMRIELGIMPTVEGANNACFNGHLEVLEWLAESKIFPDEVGIIYATKRTYTKVLEWLNKKFGYNIDYYQRIVDSWEHTQINSLQYLLGKVSKGTWSFKADNACGDGYLRVIKWIKNNTGVIPTKEGANEACKNGDLKVLLWLVDEKVYPDYRGMDIVCEHGHVRVFRWIRRTLGIFPSRDGADRACKNGRLDILKILESHSILPSNKEISKVFLNCKFSMISFFGAKVQG